MITIRKLSSIGSRLVTRSTLSCVKWKGREYAFMFYEFASSTLYYQLDPLSRRSLLVHPPSSEPAQTVPAFILSSTRSAEAREGGLKMRALLGGEGGEIKLGEIVVQPVDGRLEMDLTHAWVPRTCVPGPSRWTRIQPVNMALPPAEERLSFDPTTVQAFVEQLHAAVKRRVENIPPQPTAHSAKVAILFSGGLDCTFLAYLVHLSLPPSEPIDLINVAFERPPRRPEYHADKGKGKGKGKRKEEDEEPGEGWEVPDRVSGLEAVGELRKVCAGREWRFVEVNVRYEECMAARQTVLDLMYPNDTEMDLSLAFPLYFASRGGGLVNSQPYHVKAKVYISGLGADEQLGGYARHRRAYEHTGWPGLIDEIQLDLDRLPSRNLSRDDRIIASHARDARYPYLDLAFVEHLSSLPMWEKCDFSSSSSSRESGRNEHGKSGTVGDGDFSDKKLLRLAAAGVGLVGTSKRVKRAMQFGTRSAKVGTGGKGPGVGAKTVT